MNTKPINHIIALIVSLLALLCCSCKNKVLSDGVYQVDVKLEGGSGRATVQSPTVMEVRNGKYFLTLVWNSKNYDYMVFNGVKYLNETPGEKSTFNFQILDYTQPLNVIADTVAMSVPREIEYTITLSNISKNDQSGPDYNSLKKTASLGLLYAKQFQVDSYGEYSLITIADTDKYLVIPPTSTIPSNIPEGITVLKQPLKNIYLVSTPVMDLVTKIDALKYIRFTGTKADDWYIDEAVNKINNGEIIYSGKYSSPDFEKLVSGDCRLAIENTMIYHKPEIKEKLEELAIPVLVEKSGYEDHPFGRLEWIKLYGILFNKLTEAEDYFDKQISIINPILNDNSSNKKIAFFYVTSNGTVSVRKNNDYITKMINLAGGKYFLNDWEISSENALSSINMQIEDFYSKAVDSDIIIYNSTIDGVLENKKSLIDKDSIFLDFKAYNEDKVYCTTKNFFQKTTSVALFMEDINKIIKGNDDNLVYLRKLD